MEFDRIITQQAQADKFKGMEKAIQDGRKGWCWFQLFRETKFRLQATSVREESRLRAPNRMEERFIDNFQREFNEDPFDEIEKIINEELLEFRR